VSAEYPCDSNMFELRTFLAYSKFVERYKRLVVQCEFAGKVLVLHLKHIQNLHSGKMSLNILHGPLVHAGKTLTHLQILSPELHQNAFGAAALRPNPLGTCSTPPRPLAVNRGRGRERKVGNMEGGKKRSDGEEREGKGGEERVSGILSPTTWQP